MNTQAKMKLTFNKDTIAELNDNLLYGVNGGTSGTLGDTGANQGGNLTGNTSDGNNTDSDIRSRPTSFG